MATAITAKNSTTSKESKPKYYTYEDYPVDDLLQYAGVDCIATSEIFARQFPHITSTDKVIDCSKGKRSWKKLPPMLDTIQQFEMKALDFIIDLEYNGFAYDVSENRRIGKEMVEVVSTLEESIFSSMTRKVNLDSGEDVSRYLYGELGFEPPSYTKSGAPATDGEALLTLAGLDFMNPGKYIAPDPSKQFLADMAKRKDIESVRRTFISTYVEDFVKSDGRIHPTYNLHGTSSYRITGDSPNLTQLPRAKHGFNVRQCFTSSPGYALILFDFSSAEVDFAS